MLACKPTPCYAPRRIPNLAQMKPSLDKPCFSRRVQVASWWLAICQPFYVLSTGPVAWATNDAFHPAYPPEESALPAASPTRKDRVDRQPFLLVDGDRLGWLPCRLHHALAEDDPPLSRLADAPPKRLTGACFSKTFLCRSRLSRLKWTRKPASRF
jgi:hypothetical protein